jgi:hypothetical protein
VTSLYGDQRLFVGLDSINGNDVQSLYASAGSATPELDITPITDRRIDALLSVLTQVFAKISGSKFGESNPRLEHMIGQLSDLSFNLESGLALVPTGVLSVSGGGVYKGTATLTATLASGDSPLSGKTVSFSLNGSAVGTATTNSDGTATLSGVSLSGVNAGTYPNVVGAGFAGDTSFAGGSATGTLSVSKANQTITFAVLADKTFGDADFAVNASASSGLQVSLAAGGQCAVTSGTVHITGSGSCAITSSQAGDSNYNAAAGVVRSFPISKAATAVALASTLSPSAPGQPVTFTAAVTSAAGTPTGAVQFKVNGKDLGGAITCSAGAGGGCKAQVSTSSLTIGVHTVTVSYGGDANFGASAGTLPGGQAVGGTFDFSQRLYGVAERGGSVKVTVRRTGDTSRAMTVDYSTDDGSIPSVAVPCSSATGLALERCDYTRAAGTLQFALGETEKTFAVIVNDDSYVEGSETTHLRLSNPAGGPSWASSLRPCLRSLMTLRKRPPTRTTTTRRLSASTITTSSTASPTPRA